VLDDKINNADDPKQHIIDDVQYDHEQSILDMITAEQQFEAMHMPVEGISVRVSELTLLICTIIVTFSVTCFHATAAHYYASSSLYTAKNHAM